jgi:hypothetical protein
MAREVGIIAPKSKLRTKGEPVVRVESVGRAGNERADRAAGAEDRNAASPIHVLLDVAVEEGEAGLCGQADREIADHPAEEFSAHWLFNASATERC